MYTNLFLAQALVQLLLLAWLVRIWRRTGLAVALALLVPQFGLVYDNLIVGLGAYIGFGDFLEAISWPRFWIHWFFGAWLIVACGAILRLAGIPWAQHRGAMVAFCALTAAMMVIDLPYFWTLTDLHPVCEFDLVRYSVQVPREALCSADQQPVPGQGPPIPQIVTCLVVIASGAVLMVKRRFPWVFGGGLLMLFSAMPPLSTYKLDNFGEILIAGGCIWGIAHFSNGRRAWVSRTA
jgi:hypothetical protein